MFLTADPRERARRRVLQRHEGEHVDDALFDAEIEQTLTDIERRDAIDSQRDAVRIDSTSFTIEEIVNQIERLIAE